MLFSVERAFVGREEIRSPLKTPAVEAKYNTVTYGKLSLRHLGPNLWGKLSPDLREVTTLKCFKNKIRTLDIVTLMDNGCKCCHLCNS